MKLDTFKPYDVIPLENGFYSHSYDYVEFRPSYTEYGGYNGYDDNTIDSAFEGMPEATWNID